MLIADLLNGIIYECGNIAQSNARAVGLVAFIIPSIFFVVLSVAYIIYTVIKIFRSEDFQLGKIFNFVFSIFSLAGLILYLIADNYYLIEQINNDVFIIALNDTSEIKLEIIQRINAIQPSFLFFAIILYRIIPQGFSGLIKHGNDDDIVSEDDSVWIGVIHALMVITDFDSWFTLIQSTNDCSIQLKWVWAMWVVIIALYMVYMLIRSTIGCYKNSDGAICAYPVMIFIMIAFLFYLLGDNRQPLDCHLVGYSRSSLKLFFLICAFCIFSPIIVFTCYNIIIVPTSVIIDNDYYF